MEHRSTDDVLMCDAHHCRLCNGTASSEAIANITAELTLIHERSLAGSVIDAPVVTDDEFDAMMSTPTESLWWGVA